MTEWQEAREIPANAALLKWLEARAEPPRPGGFEFDGFELHAHPDLVERLVECVNGLPIDLVAAFGIPGVARRDGAVIAFGRGTHQVFIRGLDADHVSRPAGLGREWGAIDAFFPEQWSHLSLEQRMLRQAEDQRGLMLRIRDLVEGACAAPLPDVK